MAHDLAYEAIERAYREHAAPIWRGVFAFSGGRRDIADDAVAEAFARALANSDKVRSPVAWLYRVAFRVASKALRQERRLGQVAVHKAADPGHEAEIDAIGALEILPPNQRATVFLYYYADMSIGDIARIRRTTPVNVRVQLHRARQVLRHKYEHSAAMSRTCAADVGGDNYGRVA